MAYHTTNQLTSVSVVLPVINETSSLRETVAALEKEPRIAEFLLVVCGRTEPPSLAICLDLRARDPVRFRVIEQELPFLGGAVRDAFRAATGSHVVMMASDLETDPATVPALIEQAEAHPNAIITASRWLDGCEFEGYNPVKLAANFLFQRFFSLLYGARLTDMTYGFRIFPTVLVQAILWDELRHPFLFETLVKPMRLGVPVREVPSRWRRRREGESQNTFLANFHYWAVGFRVRFASPRSFLATS